MGLTASGRGLLAGAVALCVVGWVLGYREAVVAGVAGLIAVAGAAAWTLPRLRVTARRDLKPSNATRGDTAHGFVILANPGPRTLRGLHAEDRVAGQPVHPVDLPPVPAGSEVSARYPLPTSRRGRIDVGPLLVVRGDPLGLARRVHPQAGTMSLLVRPRTVALGALPAGRTHHLEGPSTDTADDGVLTFHALREYVVGDDLRRVHWRSTARTGTLMMRQMVDVSLPAAVVALDTAPGSYLSSDLFEEGVDIAASTACALTLGALPVMLLTGAGPLSTGAGVSPEQLLDLLALVEPRPGRDCTELLEVLESTRGGDTLVVVTGTGPGSSAALGRLAGTARRFARALLVRVGPEPAAVESVGGGLSLVHASTLKDFAVAWQREATR